jgi:predicted metalloprotease with PDZ domain
MHSGGALLPAPGTVIRRRFPAPAGGRRAVPFTRWISMRGSALPFSTFRPLALAVLVLLAGAGEAAAQPGAGRAAAADEYQLRVSEDAPLQLRVHAVLAAPDGRLEMAGWGADFNPRGWAQYVRDLTARDARGRAVPLTAVPDSAVWRLGRPVAGPVQVDYTVDLSFAAQPWRYGNEQAALYADGQLFTVSKALFVTGGGEGARTVEVALPAGWHVAAPWTRLPGAAARFEVRDRNGLINNSLVLGPAPFTSIQAGAFTFHLALLGPAAAARTEVEGALRGVLREFVRIFPTTPPTEYLMTVFRAAEPDAEAYAASAAFSEAGELTAENRLGWAHTLAHELFHAWVGHALHAAADDSGLQWFTEGFTYYYATRTLARTGLLGEGDFIRRTEHVLSRYLYFRSAPAFDGVTLRAAGARKGTYRLGVYDGGWTTAFCLDVRIRAASADTQSLDDVMRRLYEVYGVPGVPVGYDDVVRTAGEATGHSWDEFFARYVDGNETLPVAECLALAGYRGFGAAYAGDYYLVPASASAFRRELFGAAGSPP